MQRVPRDLLDELKTILTLQVVTFLPVSTSSIYQGKPRLYLQRITRFAPRDKANVLPGVTIYGLEDSDFNALLLQNGFDPANHEGLLLLNQTAQNPRKAYAHRSYIPSHKRRRQH